MTKKFCDRCNSEITRDVPYSNGIFHDEMGDYRSRRFKLPAEVDLCSDCSQDLMDFLRGSR